MTTKIIYIDELIVEELESFRGEKTEDGWLGVKLECPLVLSPFLSRHGIEEMREKRGKPTGRVYSPKKWRGKGGEEIKQTSKTFFNPVMEFLKQSHAAFSLYADMKASGASDFLCGAFLPPFSTQTVVLKGTLSQWKDWCREMMVMKERIGPEGSEAVLPYFGEKVAGFIDRA